MVWLWLRMYMQQRTSRCCLRRGMYRCCVRRAIGTKWVVRFLLEWFRLLLGACCSRCLIPQISVSKIVVRHEEWHGSLFQGHCDDVCLRIRCQRCWSFFEVSLVVSLTLDTIVKWSFDILRQFYSWLVTFQAHKVMQSRDQPNHRGLKIMGLESPMESAIFFVNVHDLVGWCLWILEAVSVIMEFEGTAQCHSPPPLRNKALMRNYGGYSDY